jgi:cell division protein FtsL
MKSLSLFLVITSCFIICLFALLIQAESTTVLVKYDCRQLIGGWHPDFPAKVIEQCRAKNNH